jgi:hypothetical protein
MSRPGTPLAALKPGEIFFEKTLDAMTSFHPLLAIVEISIATRSNNSEANKGNNM